MTAICPSETKKALKKVVPFDLKKCTFRFADYKYIPIFKKNHTEGFKKSY